MYVHKDPSSKGGVGGGKWLWEGGVSPGGGAEAWILDQTGAWSVPGECQPSPVDWHVVTAIMDRTIFNMLWAILQNKYYKYVVTTGAESLAIYMSMKPKGKVNWQIYLTSLMNDAFLFTFRQTSYHTSHKQCNHLTTEHRMECLYSLFIFNYRSHWKENIIYIKSCSVPWEPSDLCLIIIGVII